MGQISELVFDVISTDDKVILEAITKYNKMYNTDFSVMEFIYDEVVFAKLRVTKYKIADIFDLGYFFHSCVVVKREKGEIDW